MGARAGDYVEGSGLHVVWALILHSNLTEQELDLMIQLLQLLQGCISPRWATIAVCGK